MALLLSVLTFLTAVAVIVLLWLFVGTTPTRKWWRRMEAVRKAERRGDVSLSLKLVRDEMLSSVPALHRLLVAVGLVVAAARFYRAGGNEDEAGENSAGQRGNRAGIVPDRRDCTTPRFPIPWLVGVVAGDRSVFVSSRSRGGGA